VEHQTESIVFGDLEFYTVDEPKVETEEIEDDLFSDFFEYKETNEIPDCLWADGNHN
jgi:hypothetical protein